MPQANFSRRSLLIAGMGLGAGMVIGARPLAACESQACEDATTFAPKTPRKKSKKKPTENCARLRREMKKLDNKLGRVFKKRRKLYSQMERAKWNKGDLERNLKRLKGLRRQLLYLKARGYSYVTPGGSKGFVGDDSDFGDFGDPISGEIRKVDRAIKRVRGKIAKEELDYDVALYDRRQLSRDVRRLKLLIRSKLKRLKRAGCFYERPSNLYKAR